MTAGRSSTSQSVDWCTPPKYVDAVRRVLGLIELDPCSNRWSMVGAQVEWSPPKDDGLSQDWNSRTVFVNPPYGIDRTRGTTIKDWLRKCYESHERFNSEVLALIPVATNTVHWKQYVWGSATSVCFLYDTRLKFLEQGVGGGKGAPMACAMVYWGEEYQTFFDVFIHFGAVIDLRPMEGLEIGNGQQHSFTAILFG